MIVMDAGWRARSDIARLSSTIRGLHPTLETFRYILYRVDIKCHPMGKPARPRSIRVVHNDRKGFGLSREFPQMERRAYARPFTGVFGRDHGIGPKSRTADRQRGVHNKAYYR